MANDITYRLATDADINQINELYNTVYKKNRSYEQFYWEYNSAPAGRAIYVIALHENKVVGTQCAIPMYVVTADNKELLSAKLEDVLVSPDHRGKNIFGNMYKHSIEECRRQNMAFIWGFAYIIKEYKKIGFEIPFRNTMGVMVKNPVQAASYFYALTAKKNAVSYAKILGMSCLSYARYCLQAIQPKAAITLEHTQPELSSAAFNYLQDPGLFGLKLDMPFLDYRINRNPYSSNYKTACWYDAGKLKAAVYYNVTKKNVGFIIHAYMDKTLSAGDHARFMRSVIAETSLAACPVIRYWGFTNTVQSRRETSLMAKSGFTFLNRGISVVWLQLDQSLTLNPADFVLSRMASQGTD